MVSAAEPSHNTAGRAFTLAQLINTWAIRWHCWAATSPSGAASCGNPYEPLSKTQLPVHTFVAEHEPRYLEQAWQGLADLVHLSKPWRLQAVVIGLLYMGPAEKVERCFN